MNRLHGGSNQMKLFLFLSISPFIFSHLSFILSLLDLSYRNGTKISL